MNKQVEKLLNKPQPIQLSQEWFNIRKNCITASSASSLLIRDEKTCRTYIDLYNLQDTFKLDSKCCNPYSSKLEYFKNKVLGSKFTGSTATYHGQKYEPIVQHIYAVNNNTDVLEFGLLPHETIPFIACSPDGITPQGVMLEIKCPFRRQIDGIPPFYYYIQTQIQLEVCDLEYCDFVEYSFVEFSTQEEWLDEETLDIDVYNTGLFIQIEKLDPVDNNILGQEHNVYIYPEKELIDNPEKLIIWADNYMKNNPALKNTLVSVVYYKVDNLSVVRIKRDRVWFESVLPVLEKEWKKIIYYKTGNNYTKLIEQDQRVNDSKFVDININQYYSSQAPPGLLRPADFSESEDEIEN
jgi:putative phage-type endonuclease